MSEICGQEDTCQAEDEFLIPLWYIRVSAAYSIHIFWFGSHKYGVQELPGKSLDLKSLPGLLLFPKILNSLILGRSFFKLDLIFYF